MERMTEPPLMHRVALVTGAGSGIGRAAALELGKRGAAVAVNYRRSRDGAEEVVESLRATGGEAEAFSCDVTRADHVAGMVSAVEERFGRIDILVNNAGDLLERRTLAEMTEALFREVFEVNVLSTFLCSQAVANGMTARGSGVIVNMSSLAAHTGGGPGAFAYAGAKAAIIAMTKALAKELAPRGVRVNCVSPGLIGDTRFHSRFTPAETYSAVARSVPIGRGGTPEEVATVIAFLAGDDAAYLTGETIEINGGLLMR
jgi:3-oxoacyl-[acyl-carrier protein] reductase